MIRKLFCSMFVMVVAVGFVFADEWQGRITKIDGDNITVQKYKGKGKKAEKDGDPVVVNTKGAAIIGGKFDPDAKKVVDGDPIKDGWKNDMFSKLPDNGLNATITTDGDKCTKVRVFAGKKKKDTTE
jgi:hypothetical protein